MEENLKLTQQRKLLRYMEQNGSVTVRRAFLTLEINSPTKRLSELRELGYITEVDVPVMKENAKGVMVRKTHFTEYYLTNAGHKAAAALC